MPGIPVLILLVCSVLTWIFCWLNREKVQLWIYAALDRRFAKRPNLDVGLVYLFGFGNIAVMTLLLSQVFLGASPTAVDANHTNRIDPHSPTAIDSTTSTLAPDERSGRSPTVVLDEEPAEATSNGAPRPMVDQTPMALRLAQSFMMVVLLGLMMLLSRPAFGAEFWQWGWGPICEMRWTATFGVSLLVFLLLVPPVLVVHEILSLFARYEHNTLETFQQLKLSGDWVSIGFIFANTALLVPVLEESVFRGIIQGFAEQFNTYRQQWMRWALGPLNETAARWLGLSRAANDARLAGKGHRTKDSTEAFWGPIVFSSLLFGIAHTGQGAAPISLYFFAMGLGWIYKKTGNLGICILVHVMLNTWTLAVALFS